MALIEYVKVRHLDKSEHQMDIKKKLDWVETAGKLHAPSIQVQHDYLKKDILIMYKLIFITKF